MAQYLGIYPVVRKLGEGGMGKIYLVQDPVDNSFWAAKEFKGDLTRPLLVQRFRREFRALQTLNHPAIVHVRNLEYSTKNMFFLMEYVSGTSLDQILSQPRVRNTAWIKQVLSWIRYLCDPLDYIHSQNMVHRDLKPGNIMILDSPDSIPLKLLDFGVVHWSLGDSLATGKPGFFGSLRYMAPEQIGTDLPDRRSDLYSLGVILYEALTGKPPFSVDNPLLLMNLHQTGDPPPPRKLNIYVSEKLQNLVLALLFKRPDDRPSSAGEVADWIDQILDDHEFQTGVSKASPFASASLFHPEFTGRENEVKILLKAWHKTRSGQVQVCSVCGPGGIGKSRLIKQLFRMPDLSVQPVCKGEFLVNGSIYSGFANALKAGLSIVKTRHKFGYANSSDTFEHLKTLFLETIDVLESRPDTHSNIHTKQEISARILQLMKNISENRPLVLILDDLHHAGNGDLQLLKAMIELHILNQSTSDDQGLFVVLGYRCDNNHVSDAMQTFIEWLNQNKFVVHCPLEGLSKSSVDNVVRSMLGGSPAPALADSVYPLSNGNPFYIIEKVKEIIDLKPELQWRSESTDDDALITVAQDHLNDILVRRMNKIREHAYDVLIASAILGYSFRADELEQVTGLDDKMFLDQVDFLIRNQILEEDPTQRDSYRFTHIKLMESVVNSLPETEAIQVHCRCLEVMEELHQDNLKIVANRLIKHADICQMHAKTFTYHLLASEHSNWLSDQIVALDHLEKAMKLYSDTKIDTALYRHDYLKAIISLGSLLRRTGEFERAEKLLADIITELETTPCDEHIAQAHMQLGALYGQQGRINQAMEHLSTSLAIFNKLNDVPMIIDCYTNMGASFNYVGDPSNLRKYTALAMEKADSINDHFRLATTLINLGVSYVICKDIQNGLPYLERALELSEVIKSDKLKGYCLVTMATAYINTERIPDYSDRILDYIDKALETVRKTGDMPLLADCLYKRSYSCRELNKPFEDDLDRAASLFKQLGQQKYVNEINAFREKITTKGGTVNEPVK